MGCFCKVVNIQKGMKNKKGLGPLLKREGDLNPLWFIFYARLPDRTDPSIPDGNDFGYHQNPPNMPNKPPNVPPQPGVAPRPAIVLREPRMDIPKYLEGFRF